MDHLIWTAWRAFWVGLGASVVLIGQTLLAPPPAASAPPRVEEPAPQVDEPVRARPKSAEPILSRNPFDSTGGVAARIRGTS